MNQECNNKSIKEYHLKHLKTDVQARSVTKGSRNDYDSKRLKTLTKHGAPKQSQSITPKRLGGHFKAQTGKLDDGNKLEDGFSSEHNISTLRRDNTKPED